MFPEPIYRPPSPPSVATKFVPNGNAVEYTEHNLSYLTPARAPSAISSLMVNNSWSLPARIDNTSTNIAHIPDLQNIVLSYLGYDIFEHSQPQTINTVNPCIFLEKGCRLFAYCILL